MRATIGIGIARLALVLLTFGTCFMQVACAARADAANRLNQNSLIVPAPKDGRAHPLVAVLAENAGTETTDFVIPYAILTESHVANVLTVSTDPGIVKLMPALQVRADLTIKQFDASNPHGADIVIVPAMHRSDNPAVLAWVRTQAAKGALVVSICDGAWVLARAGLLRGKMATAHWYSLSRLDNQYPETTWVRNRRYVPDGNVLTTSGVTASIPASLALVEAIAGRTTAEATAKQLGAAAWSAAHNSAPFTLSAGRVAVAAKNLLAIWRHETVELPVNEGFDEISVALTADAWSRTWRSDAVATSEAGAVRSRRGLVLVPVVAARVDRYVLTPYAGTPATALDVALKGIASRYGTATADFVALQLEYAEQ